MHRPRLFRIKVWTLIGSPAIYPFFLCISSPVMRVLSSPIIRFGSTMAFLVLTESALAQIAIQDIVCAHFSYGFAVYWLCFCTVGDGLGQIGVAQQAVFIIAHYFWSSWSSWSGRHRDWWCSCLSDSCRIWRHLEQVFLVSRCSESSLTAACVISGYFFPFVEPIEGQSSSQPSSQITQANTCFSPKIHKTT